MSLSQQPPQHSLSWLLRTRITIIVITLLMFDHCQHAWQRLTSPHPPIINSPQDQPVDWEPVLDNEEPDIHQWLEQLDDPIIQIICADHLDRCLSHDYQKS